MAKSRAIPENTKLDESPPDITEATKSPIATKANATVLPRKIASRALEASDFRANQLITAIAKSKLNGTRILVINTADALASSPNVVTGST